MKTAKLKTLLIDLEPAVLKSDEIPILKTICITNDRILSYNTIIGCCVFTDLFSDWDSAVCVPFMKLKTFINGAPSEDIEFKFDEDILSLKSGNSSAKLPLEPADDFPDFTDLVEKSKQSSNSITDDFVRGLKACLPFTAKRSSRIVLQGIHVAGNEVISTDGIKIALYQISECQLEKDLNFTIPFEMGKVLKGSDSIYFDDEKIAIVNGNVIYFSGLLSGDFPDVTKYFPKVKKFIHFPKDEMKVALKKVGDFSEEGLEDAECELSFEDGIQIKYLGNVAQVEEYFDFGGKLPNQKFKLNPYHFEKILQYCDRFAFVERDSLDILYAVSDNGKFKCLLSLDRV